MLDNSSPVKLLETWSQLFMVIKLGFTAPSINILFPTPFPPMQPHINTPPLPCFMVGTVHCGSHARSMPNQLDTVWSKLIYFSFIRPKHVLPIIIRILSCLAKLNLAVCAVFVSDGFLLGWCLKRLCSELSALSVISSLAFPIAPNHCCRCVSAYIHFFILSHVWEDSQSGFLIVLAIFYNVATTVVATQDMCCHLYAVRQWIKSKDGGWMPH